MPSCTCEFRFYEELNDYLPPEQRKRTIAREITGTPSVKDAIESLGVPHTEIDLILVDGQSVRFDRRLRGGERIAVYPEFERFDISPLHRLRPKPLREPRFVADVHLGTLARFLRLLGSTLATTTAWTMRSLRRSRHGRSGFCSRVMWGCSSARPSCGGSGCVRAIPSSR